MNIIDMAGNNRYKNIILGLLRAILLFSFVLDEYNQKPKKSIRLKNNNEKKPKRKTKKSKTKKNKTKTNYKITTISSLAFFSIDQSINQ